MDKECFFFAILKHLTLFDGDMLATTVWCAHNRTTGTILYYIRYHKFKSFWPLLYGVHIIEPEQFCIT